MTIKIMSFYSTTVNLSCYNSYILLKCLTIWMSSNKHEKHNSYKNSVFLITEPWTHWFLSKTYWYKHVGIRKLAQMEISCLHQDDCFLDSVTIPYFMTCYMWTWICLRLNNQATVFTLNLYNCCNKKYFFGFWIF